MNKINELCKQILAIKPEDRLGYVSALISVLGYIDGGVVSWVNQLQHIDVDRATEKWLDETLEGFKKISIEFFKHSDKMLNLFPQKNEKKDDAVGVV